MIKNVFFDVDDTLISYTKSIPKMIEEMFGKFNYSYDIEEVRRVYYEESEKLWRDLYDGKITGAEIRKKRWPIIIRALSLPVYDEDELEYEFRLALSHQYPLEDGALETLKCLKEKGYKIVIASNGVFWCQKERLDKSGLGDYIDEIYCSDDIGSEKPFAQLYNAVLEGSGCLPEETLMVGDSLIADVKGAKQAGLFACYYNPDGKEDSIGADYVITKLEDLTKIL